MKKRMIEKFSLALILLVFLFSFASATNVNSNTCDIVTRASCGGQTLDGLGTEYIVMGLSAQTNAHGYLPSSTTSPYVLCCGFGTGITACNSNNANKLVGLSSITNAHAEIPLGTTYANSVCYEDLKCISTPSNCGSTEYPLSVLSLTSTTNAHIGGVTNYSVKICCNNLPVAPCAITSVEWSATNAIVGTSVSLIVHGNGAQCGGQNVYSKVWKDNLLLDAEANVQPVNPIQFDGDTATGTWTAEESDSNYYFRASLESDLTPYRQSSNIAILPDTYCEDNSIGRCEDYDTQAYCEGQQDDHSDLCGVAADYPPEGVTCSETSPCNCKWDETKPEGQKCLFSVEYISLGACGDGSINPFNNNGVSEQCDPDSGANVFNTNSDTCQELSTNLGMDSFTGGTLGCDALSCAFDTSSCATSSTPICGDNVVNQISEVCDGTNLGGQSCGTLGYDGGILSCSNCQLNKDACTIEEGTEGYPDICGDGLIQTPNAGNRNEQCDPSDAPWAEGIINLNGKSCSSFGGTGSGLNCRSDCTFDYSSCGITPACQNGIVDQVTEECDDPDLQGATCEYLGFNEGTLVCSDECKIDDDLSTCSGGETGTSSSCMYSSTVVTNCEEGNGKKTIQFQGVWEGLENSGENYIKCITPVTKVYPCPAQVQLPFFDYMQMIVTSLVIAIIYAISVFKIKFKKRSKK